MSALIAAASADLLWPLDLDCRYIDGRNWRILSDFRFASPSPEFPSVLIPAGFVTDFASIPRALWRWMPPTDRRIGKMAVVHDWYYRTPSIDVTRRQADEALRAGMLVLGANRFDRAAVYYGVRLGGEHAYKARRTA